MRTLSLLTAIVSAMFLSAPVYADSIPTPSRVDVRPAIVQIFLDPTCSKDPIGAGTGFVIGNQPVGNNLNLITIMTAHHVAHNMPCVDISWRGEPLDKAHVEIYRPSAIHIQAWSNDVVEFQIVASHNPPVLELGTQAPTFGQPVSIVGFPNAGPMVLVLGEISGDPQELNVPGARYTAIPVTTTSGFCPGISGSPVFNSAGQVVAVADAVDEGEAGIDHGYIVTVPTIQ